MEEIDHNIIVETGNLGSNNAIIHTERGLVLIDSPHKPTDAVKWRGEVDSRGEVAYLVNTDHHIDHTMGNFFLPGTIVSHQQTREKLLTAAPTLDFMKWLLQTLDPPGIELMEGYVTRVPTITMNDTMTLHLGDVTLELSHQAGHTANGIMVLLVEQKILFAGDLVCEAGLPSFQEACVFPWLENLRRVMEMDIRFIVPGHGKVCTLAGARAFHDQISALVDEVKHAMAVGKSRDEIVAAIRFPDNIHTTTESYQGYPDDMNEGFQIKSIGAIYDQVVEAGA
jgi:cyclase